jgi:hypothetical protein
MLSKTGRYLTLAILGAITFAHSSWATTIDSFTFTQGDYSEGQIISASLFGTFAGVVEPDGFIERADLTSFSVALDNVTPAFFSYDTNGGASSLNFAAVVDGADVCVGATAAFGGNINGVNCGTGGSITGYDSGFGFTFTTNQFPQITLVSSVTTSAAPEPATWEICVLAALLMLVGCYAREKSSPKYGRHVDISNQNS